MFLPVPAASNDPEQRENAAIANQKRQPTEAPLAAPPLFMILVMANAIALNAVIFATVTNQRHYLILWLYLWLLGFSCVIVSPFYYRFSVSHCLAIALYLFAVFQSIMLFKIE